MSQFFDMIAQFLYELLMSFLTSVFTSTVVIKIKRDKKQGLS